jgi:hypothetical protein
MQNEMVSIRVSGPLNLFTVRKALVYLQREGVQKFNDGMYHVSISRDAMAALLSGFSAADAADAGFSVVNENPKRIVFAGLRWEINNGVFQDRAEDIAVFGPKSDPLQTHLIEQEEGEHGIDNSRPKES